MFTANKQPIRWLLTLSLTLTLLLGLAGAALASDFRGGDAITIAKNEVIDDDLIITAQTVIVDGTINGDLVVAGREIVINGTVNGSVLATGQSLTINGKVGGTLYSAGASLKLGSKAVVERNFFFGGYSLQTEPGSVVKRDGTIGGYQAMLKGEIQRDLLAGVGALELNGVVGRNATIEVGEPNATVPPVYWRSFVQGDLPAAIQPGLRIGSDAKIAGKLSYTSRVEQTSGIAAQPQGGVAYSTPTANQTGGTAAVVTVARPQNPVINWLWSRLRELVTLLFLGGLALWLLPKLFQRVVEHVRTEPLPATAWGFVVMIIGYLAAMLAAVLLIVLVIGLGMLTLGGLAWGAFWSGTVGLGAFFTFFTLLIAFGSKLVVAYPVGQWIMQRLQGGTASEPVGWQQGWPLLVGVLLYAVVAGIPYFGFVVNILVTLLGLGAMWLSWRERTTKIVAPTLVLQPA